MARKRKRKTGEFEGATCHRCDLTPDLQEGTCPNDRCPFHFVFQDEVIDDDHPSDEVRQYIEQLRYRSGKEA